MSIVWGLTPLWEEVGNSLFTPLAGGGVVYYETQRICRTRQSYTPRHRLTYGIVCTMQDHSKTVGNVNNTQATAGTTNVVRRRRPHIYTLRI